MNFLRVKKRWMTSTTLNPPVASQLCSWQFVTPSPLFLYTLPPNCWTTPCQPPCRLCSICLNSGRQTAHCSDAHALFLPPLLRGSYPFVWLKTIYVLLAPKYSSPPQISPLNSRLLPATAYFMFPPEIVLYFLSLICSKGNPRRLFTSSQAFFHILSKWSRGKSHLLIIHTQNLESHLIALFQHTSFLIPP